MTILELADPGRKCTRCNVRFWGGEFKLCPECRRIQRIKTRHHRRRLRRKNICIYCGKVKTKGVVRCACCRKKHRRVMDRVDVRKTLTEKTAELITQVLALPPAHRNKLMRAVEDAELADWKKWTGDNA